MIARKAGLEERRTLPASTARAQSDFDHVSGLEVVHINELWSDDFEVLHWVVERFERGGPSIEVGEALRVFPAEQYDSVRESLRRLSSHSYVVAVNGRGAPRDSITRAPMVKDITERALRLVDDLPDNAELLADRILAVLAEGAVNEHDLEKRFRLEAGLKGVGGMTRDVLVDVVASAIARLTAVPQPWPHAYERVANDHS